MNKWMWALGFVSQTPKFRWAVNAGDQTPHSEDDQECGDHFIDKGLECHDGDAHRPTPGKNPYYQGGREGPEDKSKDTGQRDRSEVTPQTKKRKEGHEQKEGYGPVNFAEEQFDHYSGMLEQAWEKKTGKPLEWNDKRIGEMIEMVMRDTAREFSLDADDLGFQDSGVDYYGPEDNPLEPFRGEPKKGYKGRALWRPRSHEKETTTPREGGGKEQVPPGLRSEMGKGLYQKIQELKGKERKGDGERTESALASDMNWSGSKIMMDRAEQPVIPSCPPEKELLELDSALPSLPGASVTARPCGEGEDPERGHCNPNTTLPQRQRGLMSDEPKALRNREQSVKPKTDPQREQRTAQQVQLLKNSDPKDSKRTAWAVSKLFPGSAAQQTDRGLSGSSTPMEPRQAMRQYGDAQHSMEKSGWTKTSEMQGRSTWSKGGANVSLSLSREPGHENVMSEAGQFVNQFTVHAPRPKPKKRGLFGHIEVELNWETQPTLAEQLQWIEARPCTEGDEDSEYGPHGDDQKCVDEGGGYGDDYGDGYEDDGGEGGDVPEGYHEVDLGDPDGDPENGDWESLLDEDDDDGGEDIDVKKVMKEEEREGKQEQQKEMKEQKEYRRTATRVPRDPSLGPEDYHQFWNRDDWHIQKSREILEQRIMQPKSSEDAEAVRSLLINGPRVGGGYEKAGKLLPGQPSKEDFLGTEPDRDPII